MKLLNVNLCFRVQVPVAVYHYSAGNNPSHIQAKNPSHHPAAAV